MLDELVHFLVYWVSFECVSLKKNYTKKHASINADMIFHPSHTQNWGVHKRKREEEDCECVFFTNTTKHRIEHKLAANNVCIHMNNAILAFYQLDRFAFSIRSKGFAYVCVCVCRLECDCVSFVGLFASRRWKFFIFYVLWIFLQCQSCIEICCCKFVTKVAFFSYNIIFLSKFFFSLSLVDAISGENKKKIYQNKKIHQPYRQHRKKKIYAALA